MHLGFVFLMVCLRMILQAENKVKAKQQAEKIAQKQANKIKQRIEKKEKEREEQREKKNAGKGKNKKKGRGALQREKKRARREIEGSEDKGDSSTTKEEQLDETRNKNVTTAGSEARQKIKRPQKKGRPDKDETALEDMIRSYKASFASSAEKRDEGVPQKVSQKVLAKRWFE